MENPNYVTFPGLYQNKTYLLKEDQQYPVVIIVSDSSSVYMDDADRELLTKILQSVNITLLKAKVINIQNLDASLSHPVALPSPCVISFGVDLSTIGQNISIEHYAVQEHNEKAFLKADTLQDIAKDKQKKIALWQALKTLFADK